MENQKKVYRPSKQALSVVCILLFCLIFTAGQYALLVYADEDSLDATVTVESPAEGSYGESALASSRVFPSWRALGEPDSRGALMLWRGWVSIELEDVITDCSDISIWAAKRGWRSPDFSVYTSSDGSTWTYIGGSQCTSRSYIRYYFSGAFGEVKYIKVERNISWRWSIMSLDAVWAKRR